MIYLLLFAFSLLFYSCSNPTVQDNTTSTSRFTHVEGLNGFKIVEQHPDCLFIRISSPNRATRKQFKDAFDALSSNFDRIDFCTDVAHERGQEYASIIGNQIFDFENDCIYNL